MPDVTLDDRGRLLLPRELRKKYGEEFVVIEALGEIVLRPIPKDPIAALQKEGEKIPKDLSVADLKRIARERAMEDVLARLKRHEGLGKRFGKKKR